MQIRKFVGANMTEAMANVRREFGEDAVILSSRKFRPGDSRTSMFTKPLFEITAAIDYNFKPRYPQNGSRSLGESTSRMKNSAFDRSDEHINSKEKPTATQPAFCNESAVATAPIEPSINADGEKSNQLNALRKELNELRREASALIRITNLSEDRPELLDELNEIKSLLNSHGRNGSAEGGNAAITADLPEAPRRMIHALLKNGLDEGLADTLARSVRAKMRQRGSTDSEAYYEQLIRDELATYTPCRSYEEARDTLAKSKRQFLCALVGPTGVGKTTTLAKLAAREALAGRSVGFITLDTYRIAASEQLQTYARIMHMPIEIANSEKEFRAALVRMRECDSVFIDTPGHSHKKCDSLERQIEILAGKNVHVTLVLSLTARDSILHEIIETYNRLGFEDLIFTKLDESEEFGSIPNIVTRCQKPVAYLTTGQKVPEDLQTAKPNNITYLCLRSDLHSAFEIV